jgi:hypothetical protein
LPPKKVKSQSGYWSEACYIPDASDMHAVQAVVARFQELQGGDLVGGLCFRRFHDLAKAAHADTPAEWRTFCIDGRALGTWPRRLGQEGGPPPQDLVDQVCRCIPGRFASADFAVGLDGRWLLLEIGEGGVSGLAPGMDPAPLLQAALAAVEFRGDCVARPRGRL